MLSRRSLMALGAMAGLAACAGADRTGQLAIPPLPGFYRAITGEPYPIPAVPEGILSPDLWRQAVANPWPDRAPAQS